MAKNMVEKIRDAENEANRMIEKAKENAKEILNSSDTTVSQMKIDFEKEGQKQRRKTLALAQNKAELLKKEFERQAEREAENIIKKAESNRKNVIKSSIKILFG